MIRIMLVDDDVRAIEGIAQNVDWQSLGIGETLLAYSARQAQELFGEKDIDILLSDIEMPKGGGLELVEWVNANKEGVVCIFLTSHANFSYANRALRLGSMDYLLKPAPYPELEAAIGKAVQKVQLLRRHRLETQQATFWKDSRWQVAERFWQEIAGGTMAQNAEEIARQAQRRHVEYTGAPVRPVLLRLGPARDNAWEPSLLEAALTNILREVLACKGTPPMVLRLAPDCYCVLADERLPAADVNAACSHATQTCEEIFARPFANHVGRLVAPDALFHEVSALLAAGQPEDAPSASQPCDGEEDALARAQQYILAHLAEDMSRADIAAAVYLSADHLSHLFKAKTGGSLSDYIIEQRMERAKVLLATTRMPIHKVATEAGYDNIPYFSKLFKRATGITPNAYRKSAAL